jgi:hypothetical protein
MKTTWTSGEMSFDGTLISLGTTQKNYVWLRCPGTSIVDALVNPNKDSRACLDWSHPASGQVETFAWTPDKRYGLAIPEGTSPKMGWTKFTYDRNKSSRVCEEPDPTRSPTRPPTRPPTPSPTRSPTMPPTPGPTKAPTNSPTKESSFTPTPAPSECAGHHFKLVLQTDENANETSWELTDGDTLVAEGSGYSSSDLIEVTRCVDVGVHTFKISNSQVDGVPGWYQILYDEVVLYDSRGEYGSMEQVSFTAGDGFIMPSESPTGAPSAFSVYGLICGGVCPSGSLVDPDSIVEFSNGATYRCATLDQRYQQLFATPDACNDLAVSAQEAGCECASTAAASDDGGPTKVIAPESENTDSRPASKKWMAVGLAAVSIACIGCLIKFIYAKKRDKTDSAAGEELKVLDDDATEKSASFDATERSGSFTVKSGSTLESVIDENDSITLKPGRALLSTIGKVGNFVQACMSDVSSHSDELHSNEEQMPISV